MPIGNNQIENLIHPWTHGRSNWFFAGSLRSGKATLFGLPKTREFRVSRRSITCVDKCLSGPGFGRVFFYLRNNFSA